MTYEEALKEHLYQCEECKTLSKMNCNACRTKMAIKALELQTHNCGNCDNADYNGSNHPIYCLEHGCYMSLDNYCRNWEEA